MSKALALMLAAVLLAIAGLHLYWGLGGFWPGHDEASLVDMVIGMPAGTPIPPIWACALVAGCLIVPAGAGLIRSGVMPNFFAVAVLGAHGGAAGFRHRVCRTEREHLCHAAGGLRPRNSLL